MSSFWTPPFYDDIHHRDSYAGGQGYFIFLMIYCKQCLYYEKRVFYLQMPLLSKYLIMHSCMHGHAITVAELIGVTYGVMGARK